MDGGTIIDLHWFCSEDCWLESLDNDPPSNQYGVGGSADMPESQACGTCLAGLAGPEVLDDALDPA